MFLKIAHGVVVWDYGKWIIMERLYWGQKHPSLMTAQELLDQIQSKKEGGDNGEQINCNYHC